MKRLLVLAVAVGAIGAAAPAAAEPGLATEIYGPSVHRGESELELRGGLLNGGAADGQWQLKAEAAHAFTDWWRPAFVAEWEHEGDATEFTAIALENIFDFTATRAWPVHFGGYAEYEVNTQDGPDKLELKLLMQRVSGPLALTGNLIGERHFGSSASDEWEFGYAAEAAYAFNEDFALGIQGFGDFGASDDFGELGDHPHYWGPFAQFELGHVNAGEIELQIGYLVSAGEPAADGQFRFKLEYEFGGEH